MSAVENSSDNLCVTNLTKAWWLLHEYVGDGDTFPPRLAELPGYTTNRSLFFCPVAEKLRTQSTGSLTNLHQWTDYIYVGGQRDEPPLDVPLLICPPENHGGQYGFVLWKWGRVVRMPAERIKTLVATPWLMVTNASDLQIQYLKRDITVIVPDRLRQSYPNAYRARGVEAGEKIKGQ